MAVVAADPFAPLRAAALRGGAASSDFDLDPDASLPAARKLRPAGVLVPVIAGKSGLDVILTKRSSVLKHHPGQIAFPGGKVDPGDSDPTAAALREAREEIGLDPANVEILGTMPGHETVSGFHMFPVLGRIREDFVPIPEAGEVEEVFRVALDHVADPSRYRVEYRRWRGQWRSYFIVPYGPYYIWGATARILHGLAERMGR